MINNFVLLGALQITFPLITDFNRRYSIFNVQRCKPLKYNIYTGLVAMVHTENLVLKRMIVIALVLAMRCLNGTKRFWIGNNFLKNYPCASDHEILAKADVLAPDILLKNIVKVSGPSG